MCVWNQGSMAMMVFSTIVTVIVETLHRVFKIREEGLKLIVSQVYQDIIQPKISQAYKESGDTLDSFIGKMTKARFRVLQDNSSNTTGRLRSRFLWFQYEDKLKTLTTTKFIERLVEHLPVRH